MKYLFCCTLVPAKYEVEIRDISNASNRLLTNLCNTLKEKDELKILSYIAVDVSEEIKADIQDNDEIRYFYKKDGFFKSLIKMFRATWKETKKCDYVVAYNVVYAWILTPVIAKLNRKKSMLILADYSPKESYVGFKQRLYADIQKFFIRKFDCVIGLSENTHMYLKKKQKFMCMEGGIDQKVHDYFTEYKKPEKQSVTMMYSGILEKVTGIDLLINAFEKIDNKNVKLVISGDGSLREWLKEVTQNHENISYLGCVPYDEYMKKLKEADILINPRNMNLPENKNNFPSKIMEYLATGKMIVSTKFPGYNRYEEYVNFCESDVEDILQTLKDVINDVENQDMGAFQRNRNFAKKFIWQEQAVALREFLMDDKK